MNKFYSMIGMARKCGKIAIGHDSVLKSIKKNKYSTVIIAEDASEKTKKNLIYECNKYNCKYIIKGEKQMLGKMLGKDKVSIAAVYEKNIALYLINNS